MNVIFIVNAKAGFSGFRKEVQQGIAHLAELGCTVKRVETKGPGDATALAKQAIDDGFEVAVAVGGDGTINEIVNGLAGSQTALAVLPAGTANVYAADVGIPVASPLSIVPPVKKAVELVVTGQRRRIDLGRIILNDGSSRHFLMWCGVGLDAAISEAKKSNKTANRSLGYLTWLGSTLHLLFDYRGTRATIVTDELELRKRVIVAVISNGQLYGRVWRMTPEAKMDDGLFDLGVMMGHRWYETLRHAVILTLGKHVKDPNFHLSRTKRLSITSKRPMPVHVDGETIATTPFQVEIVPAALEIVLPKNAPERLFEAKIY